MENYFILPFTLGMIFLFAVLFIKYGLWISKLSKIDKMRIFHGFFTKRTFIAIWESIREGLLHRNIFRRSPLLGYMHMSLAFGWFLLIVFGHIEWVMYSGSGFTYPWNPIFFQYFVHDWFPGERFMANLMDFLLLLYLLFSGLQLQHY